MTSREKFEQAIKARFGDSIDYRVCKNSDGEYIAWDMQVAWWAWQAAETELAVQLANAESKCRELAADNAGLKNFIINDCHVAHIEPETFYEEEVTRYVSADGYEPETPATDVFLAEVRASELDSLAGVAETMLVKFSNQQCSSDMHEVVGWKMVLQQANNRAVQLRKGGGAQPCPHCGGIDTCSEYGCTATDQMIERYRASKGAAL